MAKITKTEHKLRFLLPKLKNCTLNTHLRGKEAKVIFIQTKSQRQIMNDAKDFETANSTANHIDLIAD